MNGSHHPYVQAAIDGEIIRLSSAQHGERNRTLFKATASLASLGLGEGEILRHLKPAADAIGLHGKEVYCTVKSGVRAGHAKPRQAVHCHAPSQSLPIQSGTQLPSRTPPDGDGRPYFQAGSNEGPRKMQDEVRRHFYKRGGRPVRIKIKRTTGSYVNWYRVQDGGGEGWQAAKPKSYHPCPYVGSLEAFDRELMGDQLFWPEGEKDCDTLSNLGLPAFTFGGTGDGLPDGIASYLQGRHLIILADNDPGGRNHALMKAAVAHPVAASVKVVEFPELPPKGDVSDYLQTASIADLQQRVANTPPWTPGESGAGAAQWRRQIISASDLKEKQFKPLRYVVPDYIPEGVTIFAGKPKIGKSWLLYDVCLASAADRFVLGSIKPAQGDVLYLALEDSQRRLKQRLKKLCPEGDWPTRLTLATSWRRADEGGVEDIAEWCASVANPMLVVIDTLEKIRQLAKPGASAYTTDYDAISALHKLAHERGIAIVVLHHVRKMEADDPFDMVSGTNGLTGAADTILILRRQTGNVTLHARGRDIEEKDTACQFEKSTCRWRFLGDAAQVFNSGERTAILRALESAGDAGMHISEIMAATERSDRNALDQLLFKMLRDGDIERIKRGVYGSLGKNGKK